MYGRLPIVKMLAATVAGTALISAVMVPINWNGQGGSTAAPKIRSRVWSRSNAWTRP